MRADFRDLCAGCTLVEAVCVMEELSVSTTLP